MVIAKMMIANAFLSQLTGNLQFVAPVCVVVLVVLAELLHLRRSRRIAYLAYGPIAAARWPGRVAVPMRALACGVLCWSLLVLYQVGQQHWQPPASDHDVHHLLIALDVSPSMNLEDAGRSERQTRSERARDVINSILDRVDLGDKRITIIAFYSSALPVVVDTVYR
ncbi:MAG: hypothetical protein N2C12_17010, partial [Planctomycetales bacterium]